MESCPKAKKPAYFSSGLASLQLGRHGRMLEIPHILTTARYWHAIAATPPTVLPSRRLHTCQPCRRPTITKPLLAIRAPVWINVRSEEHTSELQSLRHLV